MVLTSAFLLAMLALSVSPIRSHAADQPPVKTVQDDSSSKTNAVMTEELMGRLIKYTRDLKETGSLDGKISKILNLNDGTKNMPLKYSKSDAPGTHYFGLPPALDSTDILIVVKYDTLLEFYLTDKTGKLRAAGVSEIGGTYLITNEKAAPKFQKELSLFAGEAAQLPPTAANFEGTLHTGIVAIGGETTGIVLKTKADGQYELDLNKSDQLQKLADTLNGKKVVVKGDYKPRAGVEVKERRIILVKSIEAAR